MAARRRSGFTLIELLVVIAIIAILAAILFPVFARAREAARKSTCQSNIKEIAIALQTYWNDYDATLPSAGYTTTSGSPNITAYDESAFATFSTLQGQIPVPTSGTNTIPISWCQKLYNSMKSKDIMYCPSDSTDRTPTSTVSYWWKCAIEQAWWSPTLKCQKEGQFGYNADQIVFYENAGYHSGQTAGLRMDTQINVAFLDTHVRSISVVNNPVPSSGTAIKNPIGQGEPNYFNFDNEPTTGNGILPPATVASYIDPSKYSDRLP